MCMCWYTHYKKSVWQLAWWHISRLGPWWCAWLGIHTTGHAQRSKKPQCQACISRGKPCSGHAMGTLVGRGAGDIVPYNTWVVWMGPSAVWSCALMLPMCSHYYSCYCSWGEIEWNPQTWMKNCSISVAIRVHFCCPCPSACSWKENQSHVRIRTTLTTNTLSEEVCWPL